MQDGREPGESSMGFAFALGIVFGATMMFFACQYSWKLQHTASLDTAKQCGNAALACEHAAQVAKGCP